MNKIRNILSKINNVDVKFLDFIGEVEENRINKKLYYFNITDKNHKKYKSTVVYQEELNSQKDNI